MDLRQLRYFIAIVEAGSVTDASRRLHVVQPALSQRMAALESELGVQLLVRTRQGVSATPAGMELYARAKTIVKQFAAAEAATREKAGQVGGRVGVGLLRSMARYLAAPFFRRLREQEPGIVPEIVVGYSAELVQAVQDTRIDLTLRVVAPGTPASGPVVLEEPVCLVATHALLEGRPAELDLAAIQDIPLLVSPTQPIHAVMQRTAQEAGLAFRIIGSLESSNAVAELCAEGHGGFLTPKAAAQYMVDQAGGRLGKRTVRGFDRQVCLYSHPEIPKSASVQACERVLVEVLREQTGRLLA